MSRPQTSHLFYQSRQRRPVLDQARGVYMWDVDGKRYLDGSSGAMVCNIGHSNPRVLEAMRKQMDKSTFGYRLHFETEPAELLAARTAALAPEGLEKVFFVSGGSEAVESAIKLARQNAIAIGQAQRYKIISREPSYHGCTLGALALTGYAPLTAPFDPMMRPMPKIPVMVSRRSAMARACAAAKLVASAMAVASEASTRDGSAAADDWRVITPSSLSE